MLRQAGTQKFSTVFETSHLRVGCCSMQGWRKSMEDAHVAQLNIGGCKKRAFFGVFDGHQSNEAARFCRAHMLDEVMKSADKYSDNYNSIFEEAFRSIDELICYKFSASGTAANCVYLDKGKIVCANAGDSRAVLCRKGKAIPLSIDHKPYHPEEEKRIVDAGFSVENGRVNMSLAVSRALGDVDFKTNKELSWKQQAVTALPDVKVMDFSKDDEFIILACDGIWDVLSCEDCCSLVSAKLKDLEKSEESLTGDVDISLVCEDVLDHCLSPTCGAREKGTDNMTIIIVQFKPEFFA
ncbi:protein phosphatase [Angomonas deanei]|nr:protein phosphatase [Angomonas deanei]|eukprot:EPY42992.1 protein phosphatase [Angomonas deanei]